MRALRGSNKPWFSLAARREPGDGGAVYRFDIRLQGDSETVFFEV